MRWIAALLLCAMGLSAEPVKVKQATGTVLRAKGTIQTGSSSRIELELPYLAIVRIGSNSDFKFSADAKKLSLKSGTLLLSMPEKVDNVTIESGAVITALSKGALEMSNVDGRAKVIALDGRIAVSLAANTSDRRRLRAGDMVDVPPGATQMPPIVAIKLSTLLKTSVLLNMGPFPGLRAIRQNATSQTPPRPFVTGGFDPDWGGGNLLTVGPPGTAAMIRLIEQGKPLPPPPVIAPGQIPTQAQVVALEAAGLPVPNVSAADARRILHGEKIHPPATPPRVPVITPTPRPVPTRPPIIRPPIATPRPTLRPPIAVP